MSLPQEDRSYKCRGEMLEDIQVLLGGRVAEALTLDDISTGASNDIERATEIARKMVTKYGMSDKLGPIVYGSSDANEVFLGRDYKATEKTLTDHMDKLREVAERLIEDEKMDGDTFKAIMEGIVTQPESAE